jgi:hypothetical protein
VKNGITVPALVVRIAVGVLAAAVAAALVAEGPALRRYVRMERM